MPTADPPTHPPAPPRTTAAAADASPARRDERATTTAPHDGADGAMGSVLSKMQPNNEPLVAAAEAEVRDPPAPDAEVSCGNDDNNGSGGGGEGKGKERAEGVEQRATGGGQEKKQTKATMVMGMRTGGGARGGKVELAKPVERVQVRRKNAWTTESRSGPGWKVAAAGTAGEGRSSTPGKRNLDSSAQSSPGPVEKRQKVERAEEDDQQVKLPVWRSLTPRLEKLLLEAQAHDKDLEAYRARIKVLENMAREQQTLLDAYRAEETELSDSDVNYGKVANHLERKKVQLEQKSDQLHQISKEKAELKKTITELKNENAALLRKNEQWADRDEILQERIERQKGEYKELSSEKKEVSKELTAKKNEAESLKKKLQAAEKKADKFEVKFDDMLEDRDEWKEKYRKAFQAGKAQLANHKKEVNELNKQVQKLNRDKTATENTIEKLEGNLEKTEERLEKAKDKRSPCELCTNGMWGAALHLTLQACDNQENGDEALLEPIHRTIKHLAKKFPEIERIRNTGRKFIKQAPYFFEPKTTAEKLAESASSASGQKALDGGLCAMCNNDEIALALYWVIEACENPKDTDFWHKKLASQMHAWRNAYPDLIQRCLDGCDAERPIDVSSDEGSTEEDAEQHEAEESEEQNITRPKTMEEKIEEKHGEWYILLVRVQQTIQVFQEAGMPLAELGGAFKDLKAKLDKRKEDGTSSCEMQDRLDLGQKYLEERVRFWAKNSEDQDSENEQEADCTPLSVRIPEKIVELTKELEETKAKLDEQGKNPAGVLFEASGAQQNGVSWSQFNGEVQSHATPLALRFGVPEYSPGVPVRRPPTPIKARSPVRSIAEDSSTPVEHAAKTAEDEGEVNESSREGSVGSTSMEGLSSSQRSPSPVASAISAEMVADEVNSDYDEIHPTDVPEQTVVSGSSTQAEESLFDPSQETMESLLNLGGLRR